MKKIQFIILCTTVLFIQACDTSEKKIENKRVTITGVDSTNFPFDFYLYSLGEGRFLTTDTIPIKNQRFSYKTALEKPAVYGFGMSVYQLYVSPGDSVDVEFKKDGFYIKASNNEEVHKHFAHWSRLLYNLYVIKKPQDTSLVKLADKMQPLLQSIENLENNVPEDAAYNDYFHQSAKFQVEDILLNHVLDPKFGNVPWDSIPSLFKDIYETEKFKDVALYDYPFGQSFLEKYMRYVMYSKNGYNKVKDYSGGFDAVFVRELNNLDNKKLAGILALKEITEKQWYANGIFENKIETYGTFLTTDEQKQKLEEFIAKNLSPFIAGTPSPDFNFADAEGNEVSQADFKGKNIYIDIWATWCGPCKYEIPFLEKVAQSYKNKNIVFVSVSIDEKKSAWEKFINENKHSWLQLYSGGALQEKNKAFFDFYKMQGIPRFILLDEEGKLIMHNAYRPSSKELKGKLDEILENKEII